MGCTGSKSKAVVADSSSLDMASRRPPSAGSSRPAVPHRMSLDKHDREQKDADLIYECKAAYLVIFDDIEDEIKSQKELSSVLQQAGRSPTKRMLSKYWRNSTESLSFEDFCDICHKEPATTEDDLIKAFRKIDLNGDGYITNRELSKMLTQRGERMTKEEVQEIIDEVDENGDGKLDYKEFCNMLLNTQNEAKKMAIAHMERKAKKYSRRKPDPSPRSSRKEAPKISSRGGKEWVKPALASKDLKLPRPKRLKDWKLSHSKGCFFMEDDGIISSHQYTLHLDRDTSVWITIEPFSLRPGGDLNSAREVSNAPIDTMLYILGEDNSLISFTEYRDLKGKYAMRCELEAGTYKLVPFSSGCRFKRRRSEPSSETKLVKKRGDTYSLTKQFKEALSDIFEMCDLDGNGMLSREEFNFFNLRTSGEEVQDSEWDVVQENVELKKGELTRNGFIQLNEMEAVDNEGDTEDLWVTLNCMGFNKSLTIDEACTFFLEVYTEDCESELTVSSLAPVSKPLEQAIVEATIGKGESSSIKGMKDLFLHTYVSDFRACLVVENKSRSKVFIKIDCGRSTNCVSNRRHLDHSLELPAKSAMVAHHLMPEKETAEWHIKCQEIVE